MVGDSEPLLPGRDDPLVPLTDRRAPVLSRLRERRSKINNLGLHVGSRIGELALFSDEEERLEEGREIAQEFRRGLAAEVGVPEEDINQDLVEEFAAMFVVLEESDIVDETISDELIEDIREGQDEPSEEFESESDEEEDSDSESEPFPSDEEE